MSYVSVEEERIKDLLKQAILEIFREQQDIFYDLFADVIEDLALVNAIKEGESSEAVSKAEILQILESAA